MTQTDDDKFLPEHLRTMYNVFYSIIMVIGVVGNTMVILVILKTRDMRNSTNIFLANLAIADLMTLLVWGGESLFDVNSELLVVDLSESVCYVEGTIKDTLTYVSVLTILAVSFERYYAICQPMKMAYICTRDRAYKTCLLIWALALLSSSPRLTFTVYKAEDNIQVINWKYYCTELSDSLLKYAYFITSVAVFFLLPAIILLVLFLKILWRLQEAAASSVNIATNRLRRHVITMLAAVVVCFFICQLPYRVRSLLKMLPRRTLLDWFGSKGFNSLVFFCRIMIFLHAALNPALYILMSRTFREGFKNVFCDLLRRFKSERESGSRRETPPTTNGSSSA